MRYFFLLFVVLGFFFSEGRACAQSQAEMNQTAGADLDQADAKLNSLYKSLMSKNADDKQFCSDLKEAQRAWVRFVDFHMKTVFPLKDGEDPRVVYGSIYPLDYATEKTTLIKQRVEQLEKLSSDGSQ